MLYCIIKQCSADELAEGTPEEKKVVETKVDAELTTAQQKMKRKMVMRNKIQTMGKMASMLSTLRKNHEVLLEMKMMSPDGKLPKGALLETKSTIEYASKTYTKVKQLDAVNEKNPKRLNSSSSMKI